ncbi:MAG: thioredoxin domain-containing protein [Streptomycetaceae bacterium]|nr:thioredoxin domain-containing protein [Streptomycetaceae bacterium]
MSNKNSWENKSSARERLKEEREKQAKREKVRRQLIAVGSVVAALGIAAGVAVAVTHSGGSKSLTVPASATGAQGTTVIYGNPNAKHTLHLYEDPRCPICAVFEQQDGQAVLAGANEGKYKIQYTFGTFLDGNLGGTGSMNALNAIGAALNVSPDAFIKFHTAIYSAKNHPDERTDKFSDNSYLLHIATEVPALKNNTAFQNAVKNGTYSGWARKMSDSFNSSGVQGTPTAQLDGKQLNVVTNTGLMPAAQLMQSIDQQIGAK